MLYRLPRLTRFMNILLHIPHSSLSLPDIFFDGLLIDAKTLYTYNLKHSDIYTDALFDIEGVEKLVAPFSRLFCDVERYRDDKMEIMSQFGQGLLYTHMYDGLLYHMHDKDYKDKVLAYYDNHHSEFDRLALKCLEKDDLLLIIDCHSFSDDVASYFYEGDFPDIDLGVESEFYNHSILNKMIDTFSKAGYTVKINHPYKGSIIPNALFNLKPNSVVSIMIEINRRIYLDHDSVINIDKFNILKMTIRNLILTLLNMTN